MSVRSPDLCDHPDMGKFDIMGKPRVLAIVGREGQVHVSYWEGK